MSALDKLMRKPTAKLTHIEYAIKQSYAYGSITIAEPAADDLANIDAELAALRERVRVLEDGLLISGNLLTDVKNFIEVEVKVCGGVGMEYEIGLLDSIDAFQDLHGETVKDLGEKYAALKA